MPTRTFGPLPFALFLMLFAFATPAFAQSWTSANGKFTVEAEFVQIKDDKVQLKKESNGKLIWVELKKLSPEARKQAKRLQKKADGIAAKPEKTETKKTEKKKTSEAKMADSDLMKQVELECTAELKESKFNNEDPQVVVSVVASGPPAAEALKYGKVKLEKFADGTGKKLKPEEDRFSINDITKSFEKVERDGFFGNHPEDGVAVEFKLPAEMTPKMISEVSGTFSILTGGTRSIESIPDLSEKLGKTLKSDVLKKAKLKIELEKPIVEGNSYTLSFNVSGNRDSLNRIWIADAKQRELEGSQGSSNSNSGTSANYSFTYGKDVSDTAVLYIEIVDGAVELKVPFEFSDIEVAGQ